MLIDVLGDECFFSSVDLSADLRTAPTRSFANRDHDSIRLWANQQAAGPSPLILSPHGPSIRLEIRFSFRSAPIVSQMTFNRLNAFQIQRKSFT